MSSTVTCGKYAAAFAGPDKIAYYVLFESTYESNVSPKTPHWSCIYFGKIAGALKEIFGRASACEGGMLQNRNGSITPERYIDSWMRELNNPHAMGDRTIYLQKTSSWRASVKPETLEPIASRLHAAGLTNEAEALRANKEITLKLHQNAPLLASLTADSLTAPWRIIDHADSVRIAAVAPEFTYRPTPAADYALPSPDARRITSNDVIMPDSNGVWRYAGWDYSVVGKYIESLWDSELTEPGSYRKRIKAFRDAITTAPQIPTGATVTIQSLADETAYQKSRRDSFIAKYPARPSGTGFIAEVTPETMPDLAYLDPNAVAWSFPASS